MSEDGSLGDKVLEVWKTVMHAIREYGCMSPDSRSSKTIFLTTLLTDKNMQLLFQEKLTMTVLLEYLDLWLQGVGLKVAGWVYQIIFYELVQHRAKSMPYIPL